MAVTPAKFSVQCGINMEPLFYPFTHTPVALVNYSVTESLQELAQQSQNQQPSGGSCVMHNPSEDTLPPTYESLMGASASHGGGGGGSTEAPPPTYEEAMFLIGIEKLRVLLEESKYAAR